MMMKKKANSSVALLMSKLRFAVEGGEQDIAGKPDSDRMRQSVFANIRLRVDELEAAMAKNA